MNVFSKLALATVITFSSATIAIAQDSHHGAHGAAQAGHASSKAGHPAGTAAQMTEGEVRKVDKEGGKLTLRHGELKNLNMPAMTMVFRAKDPAMIDQAKVGDKVKFVAERVNGALTIVHLETVK